MVLMPRLAILVRMDTDGDSMSVRTALRPKHNCTQDLHRPRNRLSPLLVDRSRPFVPPLSTGTGRVGTVASKQTRRVAMAETTQFTIGADATCTDGVCGEVSRVVVDPIAREVTHLVVEPKHRQGLGRLVPLDLVDTATGDVRLRCTLAEFEKLDFAEETEFLSGISGYGGGYGPGEVLSWPYYAALYDVPVTRDTLPFGEVAVRRGEQVHATDGDIGRVEGLVINPRDHHVTHVLLQEGQLWSRKEVAIPISAVTRVDDGILLNLTKQEVGDLPSVNVDRQNG